MDDVKSCDSCGRQIEYRKKWARDWANVKYCSDECRRNKGAFDYRDSILHLLQSRKPGQTICPSEVLKENEKSDAILMEHVRRSARRLANENIIEITQKNRPVDPSKFRGPIRLRLKS